MPSKGEGFPGITITYNLKTKIEVKEILNQAVNAGGKLEKKAQDAFGEAI